jgi:hypothetical protein
MTRHTTFLTLYYYSRMSTGFRQSMKDEDNGKAQAVGDKFFNAVSNDDDGGGGRGALTCLDSKAACVRVEEQRWNQVPHSRVVPNLEGPLFYVALRLEFSTGAQYGALHAPNSK